MTDAERIAAIRADDAERRYLARTDVPWLLDAIAARDAIIADLNHQILKLRNPGACLTTNGVHYCCAPVGHTGNCNMWVAGELFEW